MTYKPPPVREAVIEPHAQRAHAWLRGYSDVRFEKPDGSRELFPEGQLRDAYLAGRLFSQGLYRQSYGR